MLLSLLWLAVAAHALASVHTSFGIVTDVHYANASHGGTRYYRDSIPKMHDAIKTFNNFKSDFVVCLGDLKDKDPSNSPTAALGYLDAIEAEIALFQGPRYHVLGNHDVDVLTQPEFLEHIKNVPECPHCDSYSFDQTDLHFVVLNGDFAADDTPWANIDSPNSPFKWNEPYVSSPQLTWLANDLKAASAKGQKSIVFVHYRLDGTTNSSGWIQDCTLNNAAKVRAILEDPSLGVLATFSGHDHLPDPAYTIGPNGILYFTHHAMVEGPYPANNAYSIAEVLSDCSILIQGYGNATNLTHPGPPNCSLSRPFLSRTY